MLAVGLNTVLKFNILMFLHEWICSLNFEQVFDPRVINAIL